MMFKKAQIFVALLMHKTSSELNLIFYVSTYNLRNFLDAW